MEASYEKTSFKVQASSFEEIRSNREAYSSRSSQLMSGASRFFCRLLLYLSFLRSGLPSPGWRKKSLLFLQSDAIRNSLSTPPILEQNARSIGTFDVIFSR